MTRVITGSNPSGIKSPFLPFNSHWRQAFQKQLRWNIFEGKHCEGKGRGWSFKEELVNHFEENQV